MEVEQVTSAADPDGTFEHWRIAALDRGDRPWACAQALAMDVAIDLDLPLDWPMRLESYAQLPVELASSPYPIAYDVEPAGWIRVGVVRAPDGSPAPWR